MLSFFLTSQQFSRLTAHHVLFTVLQKRNVRVFKYYCFVCSIYRAGLKLSIVKLWCSLSQQ